MSGVGQTQEGTDNEALRELKEAVISLRDETMTSGKSMYRLTLAIAVLTLAMTIATIVMLTK